MKVKWTGKVALAVFMVSILSFAAAYGDISVSTRHIRAEAAPGEAYTGSFEVTNTGTEETKVELELRDWSQTELGKITLLDPGSLEHSLSPYVQFSTRELSLLSNTTKKVEFTVDVPQESLGSRWCMIFVKETVSEGTVEGKASVPVSIAYGVQLLQINPNKINRRGGITQLNLKTGDEGSSVTAEIHFENTGTIPLRVSGYIEIRDMSGKFVGKEEIRSFTVLPEAEKRLTPKYEKELEPGEYLLLSILDFGGSYKAAKQKQFEIEK